MNEVPSSNKSARLLKAVVILLCVVIVLQLGVLLHRQVASPHRPDQMRFSRAPETALGTRLKSWFAPRQPVREASPETVWSPADQMARMHEQINSMLDQAFRDAFMFPLAPAAASNAMTAGSSAPSHSHRINQMRSQIDALFAGAMGEFGNQRMDFEEGWAELTVTPSLSVRDTEFAYEITLQLPGINKSQIQITIDGTILGIAVEQDEQRTSPGNQAGVTWKMHHAGRFERRLRLPLATSQHNTIKATFEDGVLRIVVPKAAGTESTVGRIDVS
jgi:HSP20 family protein